MLSNQPSLFQHHKIFDIADRIQNKTITNTNIDKQIDRLVTMPKCKDKYNIKIIFKVFWHGQPER